MSAIARAAQKTDYFRRCAATHDPSGPYAEWMHFCVFADDWCVLVNLSCRTDARSGPLIPRVIALVWDGHRWHGEIDTLPPGELTNRAGRIDAAFGPSRLAFEDGAYHLQVKLARADVSLDLRLEPAALPFLATNGPIGPGTRFSWVTLPRLVAAGEIVVGEVRKRVARAPAYHDHNYGPVEVSGDFSWEWGVLVTESAWSLVFARVMDRERSRVFTQAAFLWEDHEPRQSFRLQQVEMARVGLHRDPAVHTVPRELRSVVPARTPIPPRYWLRARRDDDVLEGEILTCAPTRVVFPSGDGTRVTVVNEAAGEMVLNGRVGGRTLAVRGPCMLEVADG
jgi:hypothetical protein